MVEIDPVELDKTLQRIQTALNKRYERDAEMYVSRQDALEIKRLLYNGEYDALLNMANAKVINEVVLSHVVINNLWLVGQTKDYYRNKLGKIFDFADSSFLEKVRADLDSRSIEIDLQTKELLLKTIYKKASANVCRQYLDGNTHRSNKIIKVAFSRLIQVTDSISDKVKVISRYFIKYPFLANDGDILQGAYSNLADDRKAEFIEEIVGIIRSSIIEGTDPQEAYKAVLFISDDAYNQVNQILKYFAYDTFKFEKYRFNVACTLMNSYIFTVYKQAGIRQDYSQLQEILNCFIEEYITLIKFGEGKLILPKSVFKGEDDVYSHLKKRDLKTTQVIVECITGKCFIPLYKGCLNGRISQRLIDIIEDIFRAKIGGLPEVLQKEINNIEIAKRIQTAEDLYDAIHNEENKASEKGRNDINYLWIVRLIQKVNPGSKRGAILIETLVYYSDNIYYYLPKLFALYIDNLKAGKKADEESFEVLMQFFYMFQSNAFQNRNLCSEQLSSELSFLTDPASLELIQKRENADLIDEVKESVISRAIARNERFGGRKGTFYKYLYDFQREDCKRIFDL